MVLSQCPHSPGMGSLLSHGRVTGALLERQLRPDMGTGVCTGGRGKGPHFGLFCSILPSPCSWMGPSQVTASAVWREGCSRRKGI